MSQTTGDGVPQCPLTWAMWFNEAMYFPVYLQSDPTLVMQCICSHISGEEEAILVISLKPLLNHLLHGALGRIIVLHQIHKAGYHKVRETADGKEPPCHVPVVNFKGDCSNGLCHCDDPRLALAPGSGAKRCAFERDDVIGIFRRWSVEFS